MPELTADAVLGKIKSGTKIERTDLRGLAMPKALLEGVSFRRCELDGANFEGARLAKANFKNASMREVFLAGCDLSEANLENADLESANLQGARLKGSNLTRANLEGANLQGADLTGARLTHAQLESAKLGGANLKGAVLEHANLDEADLSAAKLEGTDLTRASMSGADATDADLRGACLLGTSLDGLTLTGARVHGVIPTGQAIRDLKADWVDTSADASGKEKVTGSEAVIALLWGPAMRQATSGQAQRFFGPGDVLRNASLEFGAGASVHIESRFEHCTIAVGEGTTLVIGKAGTLEGCQVKGPGKIAVHGRFVESESPGIVGAKELVVSASGSLMAAVEQPPEHTRFAFEPGCVLRTKIRQANVNNSRRAGGNDE
jgi:uncharacterized protein YjbI with pentapeptide repeats